MTEPKTITLDDLLTHVEEGTVVDPDPNGYDGHVLTVEHYGRYPIQDLRRNYIDLLYTALGDPENFGQYSINIESHWTVVMRNDIPVSEFASKQEIESRAESSRLSRTKRRVFEAAAADMGATVQEIAQDEGMSINFVRRTLAQET